jgi:hypothetical protein
MNRRLVWKLFSALDKSEFKAVDHWIRGESGEFRNHALHLFRILCHDPERPPSPENVWTQLQPQLPFKGRLFDRYASALAGYIKEFLAFRGLKREAFSMEKEFLNELQERGAAEAFFPIARNVLNKIDRNPVISAEGYRAKYYIEQNTLNMQILTSSAIEKDGFQKLNSAFEKWVLLETASVITAQLNDHLKKNIPFRHPFAEVFMEHIRSSPSLQSILPLRLFLDVFDRLKGDKTESWEFLWKEIVDNKDRLSALNLKQLIGFTINFIILQANSTGSPKHYASILKVYDWMSREKHGHEHGLFTWIDLKTYVQAYLMIDKSGINPELIEELVGVLPEPARSDARAFNLANYYFAVEDYQKVIEYLGTHSFANLFYEVNARFILLEAKFEQFGEDEQLVSEVQSLYQYVRTRKFYSHAYKQSLLNRLNIFRRILFAQTPADFKRLQRDISKYRPLNRQARLTKWMEERRIKWMRN